MTLTLTIDDDESDLNLFSQNRAVCALMLRRPVIPTSSILCVILVMARGVGSYRPGQTSRHRIVMVVLYGSYILDE